MRKTRLAGSFFLTVLFLVSGCSKQTAPPSEYVYGENKFPALQEVVKVDENELKFSELLDSDTDETAYVYSGLENGSSIVSGYVSYLIEKERCSVIDLNGEIQEPQKDLGESGTIYVGCQGERKKGVFFLQIAWNKDSCTITPEFQQNMKLHNKERDDSVLSLNEIVDLFKSYTPSELGLSGTAMEEYSIFPEEGYIMVNDHPGIRVNVYNPSTHAYQATYIITSDGGFLFRWDRKTKQITELSVE